jgi:DUF971 family protein
MQPTALPIGGGQALRITRPAGVIAIAAASLRAACRCAECRRAQIDGTFPGEFPGLTIEGAVPIGLYAVNLMFSDGHARGIYPWSYLEELASADRAPNEAVAETG